MKAIASRDNPSFKALKKLCHNAREQQKQKQTVLDGIHLIKSYIETGALISALHVSQSALAKPEIAEMIAHYHLQSALVELSDKLFAELSTLESPSGLLAQIVITPPAQTAQLTHDSVLLDGIQDPGNLGSILRSSAAAGFTQVLLSADCVQAWSPKVLRAAMGAHFHLAIYEAADLIVFIRNFTGMSIATLPHSSTPIHELALQQKPLAWVIGHEGQGIRPALIKALSAHATIPMPGAIESLNAAAASAICLFETVRQRDALNKIMHREGFTRRS